jgi:hypothetical protein
MDCGKTFSIVGMKLECKGTKEFTAHPPTIAVDLDGTLAEEEKGKFDPDVIGKPRPGARKWMKTFRKVGARLIIWTVRGNIDIVRRWLEDNDIPWDYINDNPDQPEGASDKVIADVYLDNKGVDASGVWDDFGDEVMERI